MSFDLDKRLEADSEWICNMSLCQVRIMNDARFVWLLLIPMRDGVVEIIDLSNDDRALLMEEVSQVCETLAKLVKPHKLNVAALGNMVSQLHMHVIARQVDDAAWPGPIWGNGDAIAYEPKVLTKLVTQLSDALSNI